MSEDTSPSVHCAGCGCEGPKETARSPVYGAHPHVTCTVCIACEGKPEVVAAYRRGWNAGVKVVTDAMGETVKTVAERYRRRPAGQIL